MMADPNQIGMTQPAVVVPAAPVVVAAPVALHSVAPKPGVMQRALSSTGISLQSKSAGSGAVEPVADETPATKMRQLKEMLDEGLVTQEEFDAKKAELLARM